MIKFEKVPYEIWRADWLKANEMDDIVIKDKFEDYIKELYDNIKLPQRGTAGSAGYDFFAPQKIELKRGTYDLIPTGIRWVTDRDDIVLICAPRSGIGFKFGTRLANTLGVIDSDYQYAKNGGHIMLKITAEKSCTINVGEGMMQGIIVPFLITDDDDSTEQRTGGFGSTTK